MDPLLASRQDFQLATWNVNSLKVRIEDVIEWLLTNKPDILMMQEIKNMIPDTFTPIFQEIGYYMYHNLQATYNGVITISKIPCKKQRNEMIKFDNNPAQARFLELELNNIKLINVYVPNGNPVETEKYSYKLKFLDALYNHIKLLIDEDQDVILAGDFNIAPFDQDVYSIKSFLNDALTQKDVRNFYFKLINNLGLTDIIKHKYENTKNIYTWWDYRHGAFAKDHGLRIDHILLSPKVADYYTDSFIDKKPRLNPRPSDHTPIVCKLGFSSSSN